MTTSTGSGQQQNQRRIIEQKRGQRAWEYVSTVSKLSKDDQKDYRSRALGLNAMVQINGLGQALAFLNAKSSKYPACKLLYDQLSAWIGEMMKLEKQTDLLEWILKSAQRDQYRQATAECLAFGTWLRRFAEAELKAPDDSSTRRGE